MSKTNEAVLVLQSLVYAAKHRIANGEHPNIDCWDPLLALRQLDEAGDWLKSKFDYAALKAENDALFGSGVGE